MLTNVGATSVTIVESWIMAEFIEQDSPITPLRSFGHDDLGRLTFAGGETKDLVYPLPSEHSFAIIWNGTRRIGLEGRPAVLGAGNFVAPNFSTHTHNLTPPPHFTLTRAPPL